eukprot:comp12081_c0_seq1/m.6815 comp12081_c0_seq1/g.6815  ORF comp12081_c0_seq1/g.6815 comp12081_c0_seq1/m.6815 type:complete len:314 (-) comp12081_c0_seq1:622-1563(-)
MNDAVAPRRLMDVSRHKLGQRRHMHRLLNKLLIQSVYRCAEEEDIVRSFAECIPDDLFLGMEVVPTPAHVLCETFSPTPHRETPLRPAHAECKRRASSENVALPSALELTTEPFPMATCMSQPIHEDSRPEPRLLKRTSVCIDEDFDLTAFQGTCDDHPYETQSKRARQVDGSQILLDGALLPADCSLLQMDCSQDPVLLEPWPESAFSLSQEGGGVPVTSVPSGEMSSPESRAPTSPLSDDAGPVLSLSPEELLSKPFASDEFFLSPVFFDLAAAPFALQLATDASMADKALSAVPTKTAGGVGSCVSVSAH